MLALERGKFPCLRFSFLSSRSNQRKVRPRILRVFQIHSQIWTHVSCAGHAQIKLSDDALFIESKFLSWKRLCTSSLYESTLMSALGHLRLSHVKSIENPSSSHYQKHKIQAIFSNVHYVSLHLCLKGKYFLTRTTVSFIVIIHKLSNPRWVFLQHSINHRF